MTKITKKFIYELLKMLGFELIDTTDNGFDIFRKGNINIYIDIVRYKDSL